MKQHSNHQNTSECRAASRLKRVAASTMAIGILCATSAMSSGVAAAATTVPGYEASFADVNGDGRADHIEVTKDGVWVQPSTGTGFATGSYWTTAYYGTHGTYFADINGDGRADAIVVNDDSVTVRKSNSTGTGFLPNTTFTTGKVWGDRGTYFADINGDGKSELVAVNNSGIYAYEFTWAGDQFFRLALSNAGSFWGDRGTYFADADGDHKADAIAVNNYGVIVRRSTGRGFLLDEAWTTNPYYGTDRTGIVDPYRLAADVAAARNPSYVDRGTYFADVTGDGRADAIVTNESGVTVRRSNGTSFDGNETWTPGAYYGIRGTYFADATGDGRADAFAVNMNGVYGRISGGWLLGWRFLDTKFWATWFLGY